MTQDYKPRAIEIKKHGVTNSFGDQEWEFIIYDRASGKELGRYFDLRQEGSHIDFITANADARLSFKARGLL